MQCAGARHVKQRTVFYLCWCVVKDYLFSFKRQVYISVTMLYISGCINFPSNCFDSRPAPYNEEGAKACVSGASVSVVWGRLLSTPTLHERTKALESGIQALSSSRQRIRCMVIEIDVHCMLNPRATDPCRRVTGVASGLRM